MTNIIATITICIATLAAVIASTVFATAAWNTPPPPKPTGKPPVGHITVLPHVTCDEALKHQFINTTGASRQHQFAQLVTHVQTKRSDCPKQSWNPTPIRTRTGGMCGNISLDSNQLINEKTIPRTFRTRRGPFGETTPTYLTTRPTRDRENNLIIHWSNKPGQRPSDHANCWLYTSHDDSWTKE